MIVSIALHFGGNYGPASFEPIARAQCFLAQWMYQHTLYQEGWNKDAINLMSLLTPSDTNAACTVRPQFDSTNGTVNNTNGAFVPEYRMFVDDLLSAIPRHLRQT